MSFSTNSDMQKCSICKKETAARYMAKGGWFGRKCQMCAGRREDERKSRREGAMGIGSWVLLTILVTAGALWYFKVDLPFGDAITKLSAKLGLGSDDAGEGGGKGTMKTPRETNSEGGGAASAAAVAPVSGGQTTVLSLRSDVLFEFGSASLKAAAGGTLRDATNAIRKRAGASVVIRGYTDSIGSEPANLSLSRQRAEAVKEWMVKAGLPAKQLLVQGMGAKEPVAANTKPDGSDNPAGREQNRRVTVSITGGQG